MENFYIRFCKIPHDERRKERNFENMRKATENKIKDMYLNLASRDIEIIENRKPKLSGLKRKQEIFKM